MTTRRLPEQLPLVIGHRGACGYRPEHTLASYRLAIALGCDYVEPDLVSTRDGVLVARHENNIAATTDVADHPEFADRWATRSVDGVVVSGWFTEDFTLAELKTLRATERLPELRPGNARYDGLFEVPTFDEILELVAAESRRTGRRIGVYPETKHPSYFAGLGLALEEPMLAALRRHGLDHPGSRVFLQSFEEGNLRALARRTELPLIQLVDAPDAGMLTRAGLAAIATYAAGVGVHKDLVLPRDPATGATGEPSTLVGNAHAAGLVVHVWTLRDENHFLGTNFRVPGSAGVRGNALGEARAFLEAGVDGVFTDASDTVAEARRLWVEAARVLV